MMILYSTGCPKCNVLKKKLDDKNIQYEICTDTDKMQELEIQTVPMLQVDDSFMNFEMAVKFVNSL